MNKFFTISLISLLCATAHSAALHIDGAAVALSATKNTSPAMAVRMTGGETYYARLSTCDILGAPKTSYNGVKYSVLDGDEHGLYSEISTFNSCDAVALPAGLYRVQLRGGRGGNGGNGRGNNGTSGLDATATEYEFCLPAPTTVYAFRGGDGNNGADGPTGGNAGARGGAGSGAASGGPSALVVGGVLYKSDGGDGGHGGALKCYNDAVPTAGGGGGGGAGGTYANGMGAHRNYVIIPGENFCMSGAGGGGAPSGVGGGSNVSGGYGGDGGAGGSVAGGGNGGGSQRLIGADDTSGGAGGATLSWDCGGQMLYLYGGGGAGGVGLRGGNQFNANGAPGGSGSTNTSSTSYVRIYKI